MLKLAHPITGEVMPGGFTPAAARHAGRWKCCVPIRSPIPDDLWMELMPGRYRWGAAYGYHLASGRFGLELMQWEPASVSAVVGPGDTPKGSFQEPRFISVNGRGHQMELDWNLTGSPGKCRGPVDHRDGGLSRSGLRRSHNLGPMWDEPGTVEASCARLQQAAQILGPLNWLNQVRHCRPPSATNTMLGRMPMRPAPSAGRGPCI